MDPNAVQNSFSQPMQQLPVQHSPMQPASQTPSKNWLKIMLLILLGVVVLFVVAGGSYYLGVQKSSTSNFATKTKTLPTVVLTPTPDPTANWQTYTRGNISIKYPANFYLDSTGRGVDYIFDEQSTMNTYFSSSYPTKISDSHLAIGILSTVEKYNDLQSLANSLQANLAPNAPYIKVSVNGVVGIKVTTQSPGNETIEEYAFPTKNGNILITAEPDTSFLMPKFEQMIQTLTIN